MTQPQSETREALAGRLYEANRRAAGRWDSTPWIDVREHYSKTRDEWLAVADEALASQPPAPEALRKALSMLQSECDAHAQTMAKLERALSALPEAQREPTDERIGRIVLVMARLEIGMLRDREALEQIDAALSSEAPVPQAAPDAAREALHRLIEDGLAAGKTRAEDALLVAKYQDRLLEAPVPQREPLTDEQVDKIARDDSSGKSLEAMTGLMLAVLNAGTNGAALAAVARFRKDERIEAIKAAVRALSVAQTATPQGDQFEYVGYVDDGDVLKYGDAPANNSCHVYRRLGPVIDLANPGRPRMAILKDMLDRGEITAEQYRREERGEASESKVVERYRSRARAIRSVGKERSMKVTDEMVSRFLNWRLPDDFAPDAGITFKRVYNETSPMGPSTHEPVGTNLLNAPQARAMLEHVLGSSDGREPKEQT